MKLHIASDVERNVRAAISHDDVSKFDELASPLKWGRPSWSVSQLLDQELDHDEDRLWLWAEALSRHRNPMTRRYAPGILFKLWERGQDRAEQILLTLSDDEDWLVREYAHSYWGELLKKDFLHVLPIMEKLRASQSANNRRCVAIAARSAGNLRKDEWGEPLILLLEPLLSDKATYVRKNLGAYAIGDGLLRCYPELTLGYLRRWSRTKDEGTLWNVAMAFASYGGNKNWEEGMRVLSRLAIDRRPYVSRAVTSALLYLARRRPEIRATLEKWKMPPRREVADAVLKRLCRDK